MGIPSTLGAASIHLPFADYGFIQLVADGVNAVYNAVSFKVAKRFSQGMSILSNFTYSKSLDDSSGIRVQGYDTLFPQNSYRIRCERGLSAFNVPLRWITSVLYDLPVGKGKPLNITNAFASAIVGGWQTGGIMTVMDGVPQPLSIGGVDNSVTQSGYDRPNPTGVSPYPSNQTTAFAEAPLGTFGSAGRDNLNAPPVFGFDAELHKSWSLPSERHRLQLRFEAFNVLNHPNWAAPNGNILVGSAIPGAPANAPHSGFGVVSGLLQGTAMRQLQVAMKYAF